jgi:hypothetical protein
MQRPAKSDDGKRSRRKRAAKPEREYSLVEIYALRYLEDVIFENLLNKGYAMKAAEIAAEVAEMGVGLRLVRKVLVTSPRFATEDRRWNLTIRQLNRQPLAGAIEHHLRAYGRPMSLQMLCNEMALVERQPLAVEQYADLLPRLMSRGHTFFRTQDGRWGLWEWLLDAQDEDPERLFLRNFFLASDETKSLIRRLGNAGVTGRDSIRSGALKMLDHVKVPVPNRILCYALWEAFKGKLEPVEAFESLASDPELMLFSGAVWAPATLQPRLLRALKTLSEEAESEEVALGEEAAEVEPLAIAEGDLKELEEWLRERGRPARTAEIVESVFEIPEGSAGFQAAAETVSEVLEGYEPVQRVGRETWALPAFVPAYVNDIPESLFVATVEATALEDEEADAELEDDGLEPGLATWIHDPRYEDFGEEDEIGLAQEKEPARIEEVRYPLLYPHWEAGTMRIREIDRAFYPEEAQIVYATLADHEKTYHVWINTFNTLIYDMAPWCKASKILPGGLVTLRRGEYPDEYRIEYAEETDPLVALTTSRIRKLKALRKPAAAKPMSVFEIMCKAMADYKEPVHFLTVWAEVNVVRRTTRRMVASGLSSYHCFVQRPVGADTWIFDERKVSQGRKKAKRRYARH